MINYTQRRTKRNVSIKTVRMRNWIKKNIDSGKCGSCGGKQQEERMGMVTCVECVKRHRKNRKKFIVQIRNDVFSFLGGFCVDCKTEDRRVFTIDHIDKNGKLDRHNHRGERLPGNEIWKRYYEAAIVKNSRLRIRCYNCHAIKDLKRAV